MRYVVVTPRPSLDQSVGSVLTIFISFNFFVEWGGIGPPGQVNAVAGKKDGMKQGEIGGVLKELGYTEEQVFKF